MAGNAAYTKQQQEAIALRGRNILVSAAAGSGKTSVLTQRIVSLIKEGGDIRRMLVCTFINLATVQMRERIGRALEENAGDDLRLRAQAEYVQNADICTIHKFAIKVVKEHFLELELPPTIHIGGEDELSVLKKQAMKETFVQLGDTPELEELRIKYTKRTDQRLIHLLDQIYQFACSRPEWDGWLGEMAKKDLSKKFLALYWERVAAQADQVQYILEGCLAWSRQAGEEKQEEKDLEDLALIQRVKQAIKREDDEAYCRILQGSKIQDIQRGLGGTPLADKKTAARKLYRKMAQEASEQIAERLEEETEYLRGEMRRFDCVLRAFHKEFLQLKLEKNLMDYDDVLHYAYKLLQKKEIAEEYKEQYDWVFIDEYQDTNPIQEAILKQVSRGDNRFMVGDMKQSVYRFRLADPLIFRKKAEEFSGEESADAVVYMNDNFRSAKGVIDPINIFMEQLMSKKLGEITYTEKEKMVCRSAQEGKTELLLSQTQSEAELSKQEQEAHLVAQRILQLCEEKICDEATREERKISYGDICLLLRKKKEIGKIFAGVFEKYGIPYSLDAGAAEDAPEIETFVNLLKLVDNQIGDVELLSVLRSHIGGFGEKEFVQIRLADKAGFFAQAFFHYGQEADELGEKIRNFLERLDRLRLCAQNLTIAELLFRLRNETAYDAVLEALPGGDRRAAQFDQFLKKCMEAPEYARESLFALLHYLDQVKKERGSYTEWKEVGGQKDAVQILTIHGSKGLEFPVVILAGTGAQFNTTDLTKEILLHSQLGLAADWKNAQTLERRNTAVKSLFVYTLEQELKSEELRILYVAMTRAKQRLILSGQVKDMEKAMEKAKGKKNWYQLLSAATPLEWILTALLPRPDAIEIKKIAPRAEKNQQGDKRKQRLNELLIYGKKKPFNSWKEAEIPSKMGVSSLKPEFLPEEMPKRAQRGDGGSQFGTLVHLVLKKLGFSPAGEKEVRQQVEKLEEQRILLSEQAEQLKRNWKLIAAFTHSELAKRAQNATLVKRETPFSLAQSAKELGIAESDEMIVVQGIIDLFFEEPGGIVLIDYKTDKVEWDGTLRPETMERYKIQLKMYERALEQILNKKVKEKYLYLLRSNQEILVES